MKATLVFLVLVFLGGQRPNDDPNIVEQFPVSIKLYSESFDGVVQKTVIQRILDSTKVSVEKQPIKPKSYLPFEFPSEIGVVGSSVKIYPEFEITLKAGKDTWKLFIHDGEVIWLRSKDLPTKTRLAVNCALVKVVQTDGDKEIDKLVGVPIQLADRTIDGARRYLNGQRTISITEKNPQCDYSPKGYIWILQSPKGKISLGMGEIEGKSGNIEVLPPIGDTDQVLIQRVKTLPAPKLPVTTQKTAKVSWKGHLIFYSAIESATLITLATYQLARL